MSYKNHSQVDASDFRVFKIPGFPQSVPWCYGLDVVSCPGLTPLFTTPRCATPSNQRWVFCYFQQISLYLPSSDNFHPRGSVPKPPGIFISTWGTLCCRVNAEMSWTLISQPSASSARKWSDQMQCIAIRHANSRSNMSATHFSLAKCSK